MPTATTNRLDLRALSIGPAVPPGPRAIEVHSVFRAAVNLRLEDCGILAFLAGPSGRGFPAALTLESETDFRNWSVEAGAKGRLDATSLVIDARAGRVVVDLATARHLGPPTMPTVTAIGRAFGPTAAELERIQETKGAEVRLGGLRGASASAGPAARAIAQGLRLLERERGQSVTAGLRRMVGAGPGLTPSGDDFICGYLAAAACAPGSEDSPSFADLARAVLAAVSATDELSASMLRSAARGLFPSVLVDLARAIGADNVALSVAALRELCAWGHSSGADMATGLLHGLRTRAEAKSRRMSYVP